MQWRDPIVEEVRQIRARYAQQFGYDLKAISRDLQEQAHRSGWETVALPPRSVEVIEKPVEAPIEPA